MSSPASALICGGLPAQIVMEGMLKIRLRPWVRRMFTRVVAIVPAAVVAGVYGAAGAGRLLVLSQVGLKDQEQMMKAWLMHVLGTLSSMLHCVFAQTAEGSVSVNCSA